MDERRFKKFKPKAIQMFYNLTAQVCASNVKIPVLVPLTKWAGIVCTYKTCFSQFLKNNTDKPVIKIAVLEPLIQILLKMFGEIADSFSSENRFHNVFIAL